MPGSDDREMREHRLSDIVGAYMSTRFQEEVRTEWAVALLYRPPSLLILWLIQAAPVTPLILTLGNFALALLLPILAIWIPAQTIVPVLVGLAIVYAIVDCLDGGLARLRDQTSNLGQYLDAGSDQIYHLCFYASIGIVVETLSGPQSFGNHALALCIFAAWLAGFAKFCRIYFELRFPSANHAATPVNQANFVVSFFSGLEWAMPLVVLGLWWVDALWIFPTLIVAFSLLDFSNTQWALISRLINQLKA